MITGASSGIGAETALLLAEQGELIVLAARREAELLQVSAECLQAGAPAAIPVPCDVTRIEDCERVAFAAGSQGRDHEVCLIHCAGYAEFAQTHEMGARRIQEVILANLIGYTNMATSLLPLVIEGKPGRIVCVLSIAATQAFPGAAAYGAAKAGAMQFSACLRAEYRKQGLLVSDLVLGATDTPLWDGAAWKPDLADMLTPKAVAEVIVSLVESPRDRAVDRVDLLPVKGVL